MPRKTVLITGATGNIGLKVRAHFSTLGWNQVAIDKSQRANSEIIRADISKYDKTWSRHFENVDAVVHLAANPAPWAGWKNVYDNNYLATENVLRAAMEHRVKRFVFASSNWVMAGYRSGTERLTTSLHPRPINYYGLSKLHGERLGLHYADRGLSFIALRIGWCPSISSRHAGPHLWSRWDQSKWLSARDLCQAMERSVSSENIDYSVLNLMSANPDMRWDISETMQQIGYAPQDSHQSVVTPRVFAAEVREKYRYSLATIRLRQ